MQIRPTNNIQSTSNVNFQTQNTTQEVGSSNSVPTDQLDISVEAQMMNATTTTTSIRADRVADLRAQIASGQYDTTEKMDAALTRMLDELA
jgi:negative regulator of flagellin synthesis FlgM